MYQDDVPPDTCRRVQSHFQSDTRHLYSPGKLSIVFAICSLDMGIYSVILLKKLDAVILALIAGTFIEIAIKLEKGSIITLNF